jgi:hypothetical protein
MRETPKIGGIGLTNISSVQRFEVADQLIVDDIYATGTSI